VGARLESDDAPLAAHQDLAPGQDELEAQDDTLWPRLSSDQGDPRPREQIQLLLEVLVFRRVGARDADRYGRARIIGHEPRILLSGAGRTVVLPAPARDK